MSFQVAMMAGMAAMTVAQAASQAGQAGAAAGRQIAGLHEAERQAAVEANLNRMGTEVRAGGYLTQAAQTDVTAAEVGIATKQQEMLRRRELYRLGQANAIDLVARGGIATGQDSAAAIEAGNIAMTEEDVDTIKMMGESKKRELSFRKENLKLSAMGEGLRSIFIGAGAEGKQRQLEGQVADAGARASEATTSALLAAGGKLFSLGATFGGGGGKGVDTNAVMRDAIPQDKWSDYGVS